MKRAVTALFLVFLLIVVGVATSSFWLIKTEQGVQFAFRQAEQWLAGNTTQKLVVGNVRGTLWQGLYIDTLSWQDGNNSVQAEQVYIQVDFPVLLSRKVVVNTLSADSIRAQFPPTEEEQDPFVLPERIELSSELELQNLAVGEVVFNDQTFNNLAGKASVKNGRLDVAQLSLTTQNTDLNAQLNVVLEKPYLLNGFVTAQKNFEDVALDAKLLAQGSVERLELTLNALGQNLERNEVSQSAEAQAVLTLFKPSLLETVTVFASSFNPAQWLEGAPRASLTVNAKVLPNADFTQSVGELSVRNALPMPVQEGGLPLMNLKSRFELALKDQMPQQLDFWVDELSLADIQRAAGSATATLQWRAAAALEDGSPNPDLASGVIDFDLKTRNLDASVFADLPRKISLTGTVQGSKTPTQLRIDRLNMQDRNATLNGKALVGLTGKLPLNVQLNLKAINPGNYIPDSSPLLQGKLNGDLFFKGDLAPSGNSSKIDPFGELRLNLDNSFLADAPLTLKAQATGGTQRLSNVLLDLDVVGNTVRANGSYGTQADFVDIDIHLDELRRLGRLLDMKLAGTARLQGKLRGIGGDFSGEGNINVRQLELDQALQVEQIAGQFSLGSAPSSPWTGDIQVSQVKVPGALANTLNGMNLTLRGARNQHELKGVFNSGLQPFSRLRPLKGEFALSGGIKQLQKPIAATGWQGAITALKVEGMWIPARSFNLQSPAPLTLAGGYVELLNLVIKGEDTSLIHNKLLRMANREIRVEGEMPQFSFPRMSPILRKQLTVEPKDLIAKVKWDYLSNPEKVEGHVDVTHVSGGLQVLEDSQIDVGIQTLIARLDFDREAVSVNLNVVADEFGSVTADLRLPVVQNPQTNTWGIAGNQPMKGAVAGGFTELNWLGPLISGGVRTSGTGQVAMAIGGTANNPDVQGRLFAMDLDVFQLDQGVRLEEGNIIVDFTTDKASIDTFEFTVYNRRSPRRYLEELGPLIQGVGKITATGQWNLTGRDGEIRMVMDKVPLLQRPDRWMKVDSTVQVQQPTVEDGPLKIRGTLNVLGAYFEMPESGPQTLSDDVFIQGRSEASGAGLPIDLQVRANLGDRFYVNAEGLRTRLEGGLQLVLLEGVGGSGQRRAGRRLTANGTIQTVDGTYRAYGQDLSIERGVVNFQGPIDNPGLNVRAVRKGVAVEAGVEVTGTAQRPTVTLVSEPAVPDSEKLSWMILGRGSGSADRDSTLLLTAAAAIFGDSDESTTRKIARSIGIDDLNLSTGSLTAADSRAVGSKVAIAPGADASASILGSDDPLLSQRIVSLGKRLSDKFYLSFDQSVTTAASIVKLNYQYSRQLSFIARTGADNAVDALYQLSFD
ncbi:translocation/assembly module TamB domain-containing protein [Limnobacter parvus]|uniref:Translocation/assembly module TamB domain-containing protein n=1 Tax=Limnobacter parvus TaxID=2939690 RepID=A0ABT1XFM7_9BURK|nr:translocation/assembly module TamB domain-containing protein [Limnobacter parvus]MCR2745097.1 translocation/assembly module TamB domain-containing protein [Limnobacter parvus]